MQRPGADNTSASTTGNLPDTAASEHSRRPRRSGREHGPTGQHQPSQLPASSHQPQSSSEPASEQGQPSRHRQRHRHRQGPAEYREARQQAGPASAQDRAADVQQHSRPPEHHTRHGRPEQAAARQHQHRRGRHSLHGVQQGGSGQQQQQLPDAQQAVNSALRPAATAFHPGHPHSPDRSEAGQHSAAAAEDGTLSPRISAAATECLVCCTDLKVCSLDKRAPQGADLHEGQAA